MLEARKYEGGIELSGVAIDDDCEGWRETKRLYCRAIGDQDTNVGRQKVFIKMESVRGRRVENSRRSACVTESDERNVVDSCLNCKGFRRWRWGREQDQVIVQELLLRLFRVDYG
jgi:hypothetical protein